MSLVQTVPHKGKVAVIGAGISGLSFAYFLNKLRPDININIYEARKQPGGWIRTETVYDDIKLERGPRTIRGVSDGSLLIVDVLKQLGHGDQIEVMPKTSIANKKYLLSEKNELIQVPDDGKAKSFFKFMASDLSSGLIPGILGEPFRRKGPSQDQDESVESFMNRRFGSKSITSNIFSAVLHGIHAGDVSKLSARSIVPKLVALESDSGSIIKGMFEKRGTGKPSNPTGPLLPLSLQKYQEEISPDANLPELSTTLKKYPMLKLRDGLQTLPNSMASYLQSQPNVNISYETSIENIDFGRSSIKTRDSKTDVKYDHIRSTIDAKQLSKLLVDAPSSLTASLKKVDYISIFLVNIYSRNVPLIPKNGHGFGFLVPKKIVNPECLLGVIYDSDIEQNSIPLYRQSTKDEEENTSSYSKITLMMGGHFYNDIEVPSPKIALRKIRHVLEHRLGVNLDGITIRTDDSSSSYPSSIGDNEILISFVTNKDCIPQYNVGYGEIHDSVNKLIGNKFSFGGMAFGSGIGLPDCVQNGLEGALKVS
ncbi:protoporphyrinogen oxidase [[Candida] railenensis]|uniref:Protoporphyrinogen oxidase n=1 Tax=[Candida] railenensis TaxID=45579 RepID=A0A9P0QKW3_9ASCO|nr:protoporphyrinogen oxidase [[Candida] railenensis]